MNEYLIDLIVEAIYEDICKDTSEWSDPTGDKAVEIIELREQK